LWSKEDSKKEHFSSYASLLTLIGACTMTPSACSHLSLSLGFEMCGIVIEDDKKRSGEMKVDREVMDGLKFVLDGEFIDEDLLPELLKMNKGKLVKGVLSLIAWVVACDAKIDKLERKVEKYKSRYSNACDSLLNDSYKMIRTIAYAWILKLNC
jgi:hypothetical protein